MLAAVGLFFLFTEIASRATSIDQKMLRSLLYLEGDFAPSEMVSPDLERHYCLRPSSRQVYSGWQIVTVNSAGYRGPERPTRKRRGVYRIVCFGGSNVFGAVVNDGEAYPAQLERELNKHHPGRFEVWNAGTCAYVLSQDVAAARRSISLLDPDMMIFTVTNSGRRAFYSDRESSFSPFFEADLSLYWENLDFLPYGRSRWNQALLKHWVSYRAALVAANVALRLWLLQIPSPDSQEVRDIMRQIAVDRAVMRQPPQREAVLRLEGIRQARERRYESMIRDKVDQALNADAFREFYKRFRDRSAIFLASNPAGPSCEELESLLAPCLPLHESLPPGAPPEYGFIHPGVRVYRWYARTLARLLGPYLPGGGLERREGLRLDRLGRGPEKRPGHALGSGLVREFVGSPDAKKPGTPAGKIREPLRDRPSRASRPPRAL